MTKNPNVPIADGGTTLMKLSNVANVDTTLKRTQKLWIEIINWYKITSDSDKILYKQASSKKEIVEWLGRFEKLYKIEEIK